MGSQSQTRLSDFHFTSLLFSYSMNTFTISLLPILHFSFLHLFIYFLLLTALLRYNLYTVEFTHCKWVIQWFLVNFCSCAIIIIIQVWNTSFAPKSSPVFAYSWFLLLLSASSNHWSAFCLYSFAFFRNFLWRELNCMLSFESGFFHLMQCFWDWSTNVYQLFIPLCCLMAVL